MRMICNYFLIIYFFILINCDIQVKITKKTKFLYYYDNINTYTFNEANNYCLQNHKTQLAIIQSPEQNKELFWVLPQNVNCWIGIKDFYNRGSFNFLM